MNQSDPSQAKLIQLQELELHIAQAQSDLDSKTPELAELNEADRRRIQLNGEIQAEIDRLTDDVNLYVTHFDSIRADLYDQIGDLSQQRDELRSELEKLQGDYASQKVQQEQELQILTDKQRSIIEQTQTMQKSETLAREDLAARIRACDEREKTLKVRERKVTQGESFIQQNSALLDL